MIDFDDLDLPLARSAEGPTPDPEVKARLMARIRAERSASRGLTFALDAETPWQPHPVPGIRMKVLSLNPVQGYATLLLDVAPGTRLPRHHHSAAEECFVLSGTLTACGRTIGPGDFHHADAGTDHGEIFTDTGCRVLLIVAPEAYIPGYVR